MKKNLLTKKITALILAGTLLVSVASCSSNNENDEEEETTTTTTEETTTEEETSEETTTTEETTEETTEGSTEETTEETSEETTSAVPADDPETAEYSDPEVRSWARWYLDNGYDIEYMDHDAGESWWGQGTNIVEGFAGAAPGANLFTLDYVMKFPDHDTAIAFLDELDGSDFGTVERTENGDGSCTFVVEDGYYTGSLSTTNVIVMQFHPEAL